MATEILKFCITKTIYNMIAEYQRGVDTNTPSLRGWHASCRAYIYVHNRCMPFKGSWVSNSALLFLQKAALRLLPSGFVGWHRSAGLGPMLVSDDDLGSRSTILPRPPPLALSSRGSRSRRAFSFFPGRDILLISSISSSKRL